MDGCNIYSNIASGQVPARLLNVPRHVIHRPDETLRAPLGLQAGGGLIIYGTATLTNTNVYSNEAVQVRLLPLPRHFLHCPAEFALRALLVRSGA